MILLDTCTLLWLASDQSKLSVKAKINIESNAGSLFVSAITAFEIALKCRAKRLELRLPAMDWFSEALDFHGITELPITSSIAIFAVQLPMLHADPCDRIIIATAQMQAMKILTCDKLIAQYKEAEVIW